MAKYRGSYGIVYRYLVKDFFVSFAIAFIFFFSIFFINEILTRIGDLLAQDVPMNKVIEVALYLLPMSIPFDIPFAVLVGALMSLGRMVGDQEILVLRSGGISFQRLFGPALFLGVVLSVVGVFFNDVVIPKSYGRATEIMENLVVEDPNMQITPYSVTSFSDVKIISGDVEGNQIDNPLILLRTDSGDVEVISADSGVIQGDSTNWVISSDLSNVYSLTPNSRQKYNYQWLASDTMKLHIFLDAARGSSVWDIPGMTTKELWQEYSTRNRQYLVEQRLQDNRVLESRTRLFSQYWEVVNHQATSYDAAVADIKQLEQNYQIESSTSVPTRNAPYYGSEFYKKLALHLAPLLFMFLAFPLGLRGTKKGKVRGFLLGLVISMVYWFLLYMSTVFVLFYNSPPFITTWIGNIIIFFFGLILAFRSVKR